jgi:hypothetical protein
MRHAGIAIRTKNQLLAVGREQREAVELLMIGNALESAAIRVDQVKIKIALLRVIEI